MTRGGRESVVGRGQRRVAERAEGKERPGGPKHRTLQAATREGEGAEKENRGKRTVRTEGQNLQANPCYWLQMVRLHGREMGRCRVKMQNGRKRGYVA